MSYEAKLKDIQEHPDRHRHDFYDLTACCMVNGSLDGQLLEEHPALGYNGGQKCDVVEGPCSCGGWH